MVRLLLCIGLPGSGKTTFLDRITMLTDRFSPDDLLIDPVTKKYHWSPERLSHAWQESYRRFGRALTHFHGVAHQELLAWDGTFTTVMSRSAIINIARGADCQVDALYFNTAPFICRRRNDARPEERRVPVDYMDRFETQFQPPTKHEGFHNVIEVKPQTAHLALAEIIEWVELPLLKGARGA